MVPRLAAARGPARVSLQRAADCVGRIVAIPSEVRNTLVVLASARRACATLTSFQRPRFALLRRLRSCGVVCARVASFLRPTPLASCAQRPLPSVVASFAAATVFLLPRCFVLQAPWITSAASGTLAAQAAAGGSAADEAYVRVGTAGTVLRVKIKGLHGMDLADVLLALLQHPLFASDLKDAPMSQVTVEVAGNNLAWTQLEGQTVNELVAAGDTLHVRVRLPSAAKPLMAAELQG